jgi:S-adenosylmethionine:tRNA ribosyltransferase-isomerase
MFLDYYLPTELIAQRPVEPRDRARLLVVRRTSDTIEYRHVSDLPELLEAGDLVVVNDTRVLPARLLGQRERTGGRWEGLYLGSTEDGCWSMLCQTKGTLIVGERIVVEPRPLILTLISRPTGQPWIFRPEALGSTVELLERHGQVPLPPYIRKGRGDDADKSQYQTVFADRPGSVAAPTAGLHFTSELFARLQDRGINRAAVTLHVGLGTFQPLNDGDPDKHIMHKEWYTIPEATAAAIIETKQRGRRVIAIGTTTARTLESGAITARTGETALFIHEPYTFRAVDVLMTNFHLPRTTLLLLVGAFAGESLIRRAYETAVAERYRFFSYGDAMLIL